MSGTISAWGSPQYQAEESATRARTNQYDPLADPSPGFLGGFISSAISSTGELFGMHPFQSAEDFRAENPVSGFVSQLVGAIPPYGAAFRLSRLPSLAPRLERATEAVVGRFGLTATEAPIRAGIVREAIRFAPLEASRLAVGGLAFGAFDDGFFNSPLFADVAFSTAFTGGAGAVGGWITGRGLRQRAAPPHVAGEDLRLTPTHQYDLLLGGADLANVADDAARADYQAALRNEIMTETSAQTSLSGRALPFVRQLEGGGSADDAAAVNSLFTVRNTEPTGRGGGLDTRLLLEGKADDFRTLNTGGQGEVAAALGVEDIDQVLRNSMFPRVQEARGANGARQLNAVLSRPGWRAVGEGGFIAREGDDGAFLIAKRLAKGNGRRQGVVHGNDRWFTAKTTHPQAFFPEAAKFGEQTTAAWAKFRQMFQPGTRGDVFTQANDAFEHALDFKDYADIVKMDRRRGVKELTGRLAGKVTDAAFPGVRGGLKDSRALQELAENVYDVIKPTEFLARQNSYFGRLFGTLRNAVRTADNYSERMVRGKATVRGSPMRKSNVSFESGFEGHRPVAQMMEDITDEEANLIMHINDVGRKNPAEAAKELVESGVLSTKGVKVLEELQALNKDLLDRIVLPALRDLPTTADVKWLEGYVSPRLYRGDNFMEVKNEAGQLKWLAAGKTRAIAEREAKEVVEAAKETGQRWTYGDKRHVLDADASALDRLQSQLAAGLAREDSDNEIVFKAMKRLATMRASTGRNPAIPGSTTTLRKRSGLAGTPDVAEYGRKDLLNAVDGHIRTLTRFSAVKSWEERYGSLLANWGKYNPTLHANLTGKMRQLLGIEGKITQTLNKVLSALPGVGPRGATKIAAATNEVMYAWNLGLLNTTFAVLNALTPLQTVAPEIAFLTRAPSAEVARLYGFTPVFDNAGKVRGAGGILEPLKVLREATAMAAGRNLSKETLEMYGRAVDDNVFSGQLYENVGPNGLMQHSIRDAFKRDGYTGLLRSGATALARNSEEFSRLVSFNSGLLVGKAHFGLEGDQLYAFARRLNEQTMFQYGTVDRARLITGPVGSVFGLFKNWQMHFLGNMINYTGLALNRGVWSPLLWNVGAASALGGLGATPLKMIADGLANWADGSPSAYTWMQEHWGSSADEVYFGLPAFFGVSMQASSSIPGTDVRNDLSQLSSIVVWERAKALGRAMGNAWTVQEGTGQNGLRDPNVRDQFLAALAPRFMYRILASTEGDYIKSMATGYPQVQHVSPASRLLYGMGFNPVEVERYQVASRELYRDQEAMRSATQGLGMAYSDAMLNGDSERMEQTLRRATMMNVPLHSVIQSAMTRNRREQGDMLDRFDRVGAARYRAFLGGQPQP